LSLFKRPAYGVPFFYAAACPEFEQRATHITDRAFAQTPKGYSPFWRIIAAT